MDLHDLHSFEQNVGVPLMPSLIVNGAKIEYEDIGQGLPIILTPGGRSDMSTVRGLANHLSPNYRVIIYDRRNCGASDVVISGALSESDIWAEDLNEMLKQLGAYPAYVGGNSAGQRASLLLAIRHPEAVRGLLLWNITGGSVAAEQLGYNYYGQFIEIAETYGMQGIIESDFFAERIKNNASNLERLKSMDTQNFIDVMQNWRSFFTADTPIIGATEAQLMKIDVPTVIIPGTENDPVHPRTVGENLHKILPNAELHPPIWSPEEYDTLRLEDPSAFQEIGHDRRAPIFLDFLTSINKSN